MTTTPQYRTDEWMQSLSLPEQIAQLDQFDIVEATLKPDESDLKPHLRHWIGYRGLFRAWWFIDPDDHNGRWADELAFMPVDTELHHGDDYFGQWCPQSDLEIHRVLTSVEKRELSEKRKSRT